MENILGGFRTPNKESGESSSVAIGVHRLLYEAQLQWLAITGPEEQGDEGWVSPGTKGS